MISECISRVFLWARIVWPTSVRCLTGSSLMCLFISFLAHLNSQPHSEKGQGIPCFVQALSICSSSCRNEHQVMWDTSYSNTFIRWYQLQTMMTTHFKYCWRLHHSEWMHSRWPEMSILGENIYCNESCYNNHRIPYRKSWKILWPSKYKSSNSNLSGKYPFVIICLCLPCYSITCTHRSSTTVHFTGQRHFARQ